MTKTLDLGCGDSPRNFFGADDVYGIDLMDDVSKKIKRADLAIEEIPFDDGWFDYVTAHDVLEHIPRVAYIPERRNCFVELMNQVYRVLKNGGVFLSYTPAYPHAEAFRDPTHVNIITEETFLYYFDNKHVWASRYGFTGKFIVLRQEWMGPHLLTILQKVVS